VIQCQKGKTSLDFTEARDSEWSQWHQLDRVQLCTLLQTDNHANTPPLSSCRPIALLATQPALKAASVTCIVRSLFDALMCAERQMRIAMFSFHRLMLLPLLSSSQKLFLTKSKSG